LIPQAKVAPRFEFAETVARVARDETGGHFAEAMERAMRTAR